MIPACRAGFVDLRKRYMEFLAQSPVLKNWELSEFLCQFQFTDPNPRQLQLLGPPSGWPWKRVWGLLPCCVTLSEPLTLSGPCCLMCEMSKLL